MTRQAKERQSAAQEPAAMQAALWLWGKEYSEQKLSAIDWWKGLTEYRKRLARQCAEQIIKAWQPRPLPARRRGK